jgi:hypothetical protein
MKPNILLLIVLLFELIELFRRRYLCELTIDIKGGITKFVS